MKKCLPTALSCALVAAFVPAQARAFCREVTAPTPAGYDPAVNGCFNPPTNPSTGGPVFDLYWKSTCVGYSLAEAVSTQVSLQDATRLSAQAFGAWSGVACAGGSPPSMFAVNEGPVQCNTVGYNQTTGNQHVIIFRDRGWPYSDAANTLGLTTLTVDNTTGEIYDADIEINSHDFTFVIDGVSSPAGDGDANAGGYDLQGILTHEAGHFLGLAHSDDPSAVMYAFYTPSASPITGDDVEGICAIDQSNGSHSTSGGVIAASACDPTPRNGLATDCAGLIAVQANPGAAMCATASGCSAAGPHAPSPIGLGPPLAALVGLGALVRRRSRAPDRR